MKTYKEKQVIKNVIEKVFCNSCGEEIPFDTHEDYVHYEKVWGYNSDRDNRVDNFDLCCNCYDKITDKFKIPVYNKENIQ